MNFPGFKIGDYISIAYETRNASDTVTGLVLAFQSKETITGLNIVVVSILTKKTGEKCDFYVWDNELFKTGNLKHKRCFVKVLSEG